MGVASNAKPLRSWAETSPLTNLTENDIGYGPVESVIEDVFSEDIGPFIVFSEDAAAEDRQEHS